MKKRIEPSKIEIYQEEFDTSELGFEGMVVLETLTQLNQTLDAVIQLLTFLNKEKGGVHSALALAQAWEDLRLAGHVLPIRLYTVAVERCALVATETKDWSLLIRVLSRELDHEDIELLAGVSLAGVQSVQGLQQPQRVPQQLHCPLPDAVAPVP